MPQIIGNPTAGIGGVMLGLGTGGVGQVVILFGTGAPSEQTDQSVTAAAIGSLYLRLDGGASATLYVREPSGWDGKIIIMTRQMQERVRALTEQGVSQREIAERLERPRGFVHRAQKRMGLCLHRHGPKCPTLTENQESEILELLRTGMGTKRIAEKLGLRWHAVRTVSEKHNFHHELGTPGCRYRVSAAKREKIVSEIIERRNFCRQIAHKYGVADKFVRALAHELLGVSAFRSGYGEPLASNFPQRHHDRKLRADA